MIATQLVALAGPLDLATGRPVTEAVGQVLAELRRRPRWLLIFDNAERPQDLIEYLPGGSGHVLVTSRQPGWGALGGRLEVDVLARPETVALLRRRVPELGADLADELAAELGDLPLAAAQAAGYLESTGLGPADYLRRFRAHRESLLAKGEVLGYQGRLDTTWTLSLERLRTDSLAAVQLLQLAAFLAPEPIPLRLFTEHAELLAEPLRSTACDLDSLTDTVGLLVGFSLVRRQADRIELHRLVQAAVGHQLSATEQRSEQGQALALLAAAHPGSPDDPATWHAYEELAPHVLATIPLADDRDESRRLLLDTARYMRAEGDLRASRDITDQLLRRWRERLGADHSDTLEAAVILSDVLGWLGATESARTLGQDTLDRSRQALGPDHQTTLSAAVALASFLIGAGGELERVRTLSQDTLAHSRQVLGPDHPTTLHAATALTFALVGLGKAEPARSMGEETLQRCGDVLGPDHTTTLAVAGNLTAALVGSGEATTACVLGRDTLERARRKSGPSGPVTLWAAANLALAEATLALAPVGQGQTGALMRLAERVEPARTLAQDTLEIARLLIPDNVTTVMAEATLFAVDTMLAGGPLDEEVATRNQDALARFVGMLGTDHPATRLARASARPDESSRD